MKASLRGPFVLPHLLMLPLPTRISANGICRSRETAAHRRARRQRQQDRIAWHLLAAMARLTQHHGSAVPNLLVKIFSSAPFRTPGQENDADCFVAEMTLRSSTSKPDDDAHSMETDIESADPSSSYMTSAGGLHKNNPSPRKMSVRLRSFAHAIRAL